jgi:hypothetical protein
MQNWLVLVCFSLLACEMAASAVRLSSISNLDLKGTPFNHAMTSGALLGHGQADF